MYLHDALGPLEAGTLEHDRTVQQLRLAGWQPAAQAAVSKKTDIWRASGNLVMLVACTATAYTAQTTATRRA